MHIHSMSVVKGHNYTAIVKRWEKELQSSQFLLLFRKSE